MAKKETLESGRMGTVDRGVKALWVLGALGSFGTPGCDAQVEPNYEGEPLITINGRVEAPLSVGDVEVGMLWLGPSTGPVDDGVECRIELSNDAPSACAAACGEPSCADLALLEQWEACASQCGGPTGVSNIVVNASAGLLFDGAVGQTTTVEGEFPAEFRLDLLEPPPDAVLTGSSTGERLAIGLFIALDPEGAPFELDFAAASFPPWLLGGSGSHLLVFAPDGVPAASQWGTLLEDELVPGFHLLEVVEAELENEEGEPERATSYVPVPATDAASVSLTVADPSTIDWPLTELARSAASP